MYTALLPESLSNSGACLISAEGLLYIVSARSSSSTLDSPRRDCGVNTVHAWTDFHALLWIIAYTSLMFL